MVLSTDYDSYAIVTTCTPNTVMYNRDEITILVRQRPEFIEKEFLEKLKEEYLSIFGRADKEPLES
jgi:hypothetical protein